MRVPCDAHGIECVQLRWPVTCKCSGCLPSASLLQIVLCTVRCAAVALSARYPSVVAVRFFRFRAAAKKRYGKAQVLSTRNSVSIHTTPNPPKKSGSLAFLNRQCIDISSASMCVFGGKTNITHSVGVRIPIVFLRDEARFCCGEG